MSAGENKAVFLSYASQDAEAVGRIAEALRATGVEVWFDKNELRGGDAWDAKIRRQIKECTLFVPVISKTTDARPEGYFRLEWKLAVDRSHLMSDDHAFLVPVIIDDTPEATARVPEKFREVQWTRLVLTETPAAFARRMQDLLGDDLEPGRPRPGGRGPFDTLRAGEGAASPKRSRVPRMWTTFAPIAGLLIGVVYAVRPLFMTKPTRPPKVQVAAAEKKETPPTPAPPAPAQALSEARQLMGRAKALYEPWDGATRDDFAVAEKLLRLAIDKDQADGEVWAAFGLMTCGQVVLGIDTSQARIEQARNAAERAVRLAPDSVQARFAQAFYYRFNASTAVGVEQILRGLIKEAPNDRLLLRTLGAVLRASRKFDDALEWFDRACKLPGGDPVAEHNKYITLRSALRLTEAEAVLDAALAKRPMPYLYRDKLGALLFMHGDLDGAAEILKKLPPAIMLEDSGAFWASQVWFWRREPDQIIKLWAQVPRDLIETTEYNGPKAFLVGQAHTMAGHKAAAEAEWRAALKFVEPLGAAQPNVDRWVYWRARLLASLGRREEALEALKTFEQLTGAKGVNDSNLPIWLLLGRTTEVMDVVEKSHAQLLKLGNAPVTAQFVNNLRYNPEWDLLREDPRFAKLIERPAAK